MSDRKGFTLIELLITMFLITMVMAASYVVFFGSSKATTMQTQDARMQDNARMAMDVITRSFMRAGFLINFPNYPPGASINGLTTKLNVVNSSAGPDSVTIAGTTGATTTLTNSAAKDASQLRVVSAASFTAGTIIGIGLTDTARVTSVAGNVLNLDTTTDSGKLNIDYPGTTGFDGNPSNQEATRIVELTATTFSIDAVTDLRHPVLLAGGNPLAEDIEDLQIAYGVDRDNNMSIDATEWTNAPTVNEIDSIRLVRVTLVARAAQEDNSIKGPAGTRKVPAIEDRPERDVSSDGYRRYILTRIIKCRGMEMIVTL